MADVKNGSSQYVVVQPDSDETITVTIPVGKYREEGRREILAEIASLPWVEYVGPCDAARCFYCGGEWDRYNTDIHNSNCLWLRAQQALAPEAKRPE